ncbi:hypothetical protein ACP6JC_005624 [Aspergillus fumigatus]
MANNRPAADRYTAYPVSYLAQKTLWVEHTHWSELAQDPDHQDRFQNEECHEEDEGEELIQCTVVKELKPDKSVQEEDPACRGDRSDMNCRKPLCKSHRAVKRETAHGEDLADLDDNEAKKEQLHFPRQYYLSAMSMHSTAPV